MCRVFELIQVSNIVRAIVKVVLGVSRGYYFCSARSIGEEEFVLSC